jgi:hypothetical protein
MIYLFPLSLTKAVNLELAVGSLLTAVGFLSSTATIKALKDFKQGVVINSIVLAEVGSGKSVAMSMVKEALQDLQDFMQEKKSYFISSATIESVIHELSLRKHAVSFYDEAVQFTGMFGRYGTGKSGSNYDVGVFLDLASAPMSFQKDIKTGSNPNAFIEKPRYNVSLAGHPIGFKAEFVRERKSEDYGFFKRFLVNSAPMSVFMSADLENAGDIECDLSLIFLFIRQLNQFELTYKFDEDAKVAFAVIFDNTRRSMKQHENKDSNMCGLMSKAAAWVLKLCVVVQNIHSAFSFVMSAIDRPDKRTLCNENKILIDNHFDNETEIENIAIIKPEILNYAFNLVSYYLKQSMILADYEYSDWSEDIFEICKKIKILTESQANSSTPITKHDSLPKKLAKFILIINKSITVTTNEVNRAVKGANKDLVLDFFKDLQRLGFGTIEEILNKGPKTIVFNKNQIKDLLDDRDIVGHIHDFGLDVEELKNIIEYEPEKTKETELINEVKRRENNENDDPSIIFILII